MKYIGLKIKHFNFWVWFEVNKLNKGVEKKNKYIGVDGWGKYGGRILKLEVDIDDVNGQIMSDTLMFDLNN